MIVEGLSLAAAIGIGVAMAEIANPPEDDDEHPAEQDGGQ